MDPIGELARILRLTDRRQQSINGYVDRYLYSANMTFRYAFGRWWREPDLNTTDVWVLLNPATATPSNGPDPLSAAARVVESSRVVYEQPVAVSFHMGDGHRVILRVNLPKHSRMEHHDDRQSQYRPRSVLAGGAG